MEKHGGITSGQAEAAFIHAFIEKYRAVPAAEKGRREAECLYLQHCYAIQPPQADDLLLGRYVFPCIGFGMQDSGMGYYLNEEKLQQVLRILPEADRSCLQEAADWWRTQTGKAQLVAKTPAEVLSLMPTDRFYAESNIGFWLCRMSSTQLDFDKLLHKGIPGLKEEIAEASNGQQLYADMLLVLDRFSDVVRYHTQRLLTSTHPQRERLAAMLRHIACDAPRTFHEAVQLMYLYAIVSGTYNYGRLDEYLGDFLAADLHAGRITWAEAKAILVCLWKLMVQRNTTWNGRVIIGGLGRRNEANANLCARLVLEVADVVRDVLPQLTFRFYKGQDPALYEQALHCIGQGNVYPMLYNDEVNIPSVEKAFGVTREEAVQYLPFGCGEYILYHRSVGTPSDVINLLKALEAAIFNGFDPISGRCLGPQTGDFASFATFEDFYAAYCQQVERYVDAQAIQQRIEYQVACQHSPFLMASILFDDCIARGRAIYDGGAVYMGGTLETYGNTNTADSLTAIRKLVFEEKRISKDMLREMLLCDFKGYEEQRQWLLDAPKYGNDDPEADEMALRVHRHICEYTRSRATHCGLDSYLVVIINNSANTSMGRYTLASADGRHAFQPLANANNPSGGQDVSGLTAMLNSLVKLPTDIHAGSVQNLKLSKEMFNRFFEKTKGILNAYFTQGGSQLMVNVLGRGDLENALKEPEKYRNLIVRVGGFCARFVELEPGIQQEIMSRTMY